MAMTKLQPMTSSSLEEQGARAGGKHGGKPNRHPLQKSRVNHGRHSLLALQSRGDIVSRVLGGTDPHTESIRRDEHLHERERNTKPKRAATTKRSARTSNQRERPTCLNAPSIPRRKRQRQRRWKSHFLRRGYPRLQARPRRSIIISVHATRKQRTGGSWG
jgi:hypothetical protein